MKKWAISCYVAGILFWMLALVYHQGVYTSRLPTWLFSDSIASSTSHLVNLLTDIKFRVRGVRSPKNPIIIVDIDSTSIEQIGKWPWRRDILAKLIDSIFDAGAKLVALDIIFSEEQELIPTELKTWLRQKGFSDLERRFDADGALEGRLWSYQDRIVLEWMTESPCHPKHSENRCNSGVELPDGVAEADFEKFSYPVTGAVARPAKAMVISTNQPIINLARFLKATEYYGFANHLTESDGVVRKIGIAMQVGEKIYPSFALEMARAIRRDKSEISLTADGYVKNIKFHGMADSFVTSNTGIMEINFRGPADTFTHVSAADVLRHGMGKVSRSLASDSQKNANTSILPPNAILKGAYVLLGVGALGVGDLRPTPFDPVVSGVEIMANTVDNILANDLLSRPLAVFPILLLLMALGGGFLIYFGGRCHALLLVFCVSLMISILATCDAIAFTAYRQNWPMVFLHGETIMLGLMMLVVKYLQEEKDRKFLRAAFSRYVAPAVVDAIVKDQNLSLGGRRENLSVLFCDIRGFTTLSESLDAKELSQFLIDYNSLLTDIVFEYRGTLDKYIGDAIMAFWGAPIEQKNNAELACQAAIAIQNAVTKNRQRFKSQFGVDVRIGIGINSGMVSVGNMGSRRSFTYTVIGDEVNLASRLEGVTKVFGVVTATTRQTLDMASQATPPTALALSPTSSGPISSSTSISSSGSIPSQGSIPPHRVLGMVRVKGKLKAVEVAELLSIELTKSVHDAFKDARAKFDAGSIKEAMALFEAASAERLRIDGVTDGPSLSYIKRCKELLSEWPEKLPENWDSAWAPDK